MYLIISRLRSLRQSIETVLQYSGKGGMVRRYFITNGFDGAMSMLGIILGVGLFGGTGSLTVVTAGLGAALAMFISGFMGTYLTETAESRRRIKELNETMLVDLSSTVVGSAGRAGALIAALLQGLGALIFGIAVLSPYLLSIYVRVLEQWAIPITIGMGVMVLFILGASLGRLTRQGVVETGVKTAAVGGVTAAIMLLIDMML
jgi:predicted membrane protein (TIGR00267 family)